MELQHKIKVQKEFSTEAGSQLRESRQTSTETYRDSLVDQTIKSLPEKWETQVQSLGQEDPMEKEMATHF